MEPRFPALGVLAFGPSGSSLHCLNWSLQFHGLYSLPGSSVHGILQARILQLVTIPFSRGSSWPRDWTPALQADSWTIWATRAALLCVYVVVTIDRKFVIDAHRKERKESKHHTKDSNHITRGENKRWRVNKNYQNKVLDQPRPLTFFLGHLPGVGSTKACRLPFKNLSFA